MVDSWKTNVVGLLGIVLSLLSLINKEDRLLAGLILTAAIIFYIINSFSTDMDSYIKRIKKLEERLDIHKELIDIKSDISYLKKEVRR